MKRKHLGFRYDLASALLAILVVTGIAFAQGDALKSVDFSQDLEALTEALKDVDLEEIELDEDIGLVSGTVYDPSEEPVSLARVILRAEDGTSFVGLSDEEGVYYIFNVPPDTYKVEILPLPFGQDFKSPKVSPLEVTGGEVTEQDFQFSGSEQVIQGTLKRSNGQPITDAEIVAIRANPPGFLSALVDSQGKFSINTTGGSWRVIATPKDPLKANWKKLIGKADFDPARDTETLTLDFVVETADAQITGTVMNPDSSSVKEGTLVKLSNGQEAKVSSNGSFALSVVAGNYSISLVPADTRVSAPEPVSVTVASGETANLGVIELIKDTARIRGVVKNSKTKDGMAGVTVNVSMPESGNFQSVQTKQDGSYEISVSGGDWQISVEAPEDFVADLNSQLVTVEEKATKEVDFTLAPAPVVISGKLLDERGQEANVNGFLSITDKDGNQFGTEISFGSYSVNLSADNYEFHLVLPPEAPYSTLEDAKVSVASRDKTKNVDLKVVSNKYELSGSVRDDAGKLVKGVAVKVFGSNGEGGWQQAETSDGNFNFNVSKGDWNLGCVPVEENSGYLPLDGGDKSLTVNVSRGNVTKDCVLKRATATVSGIAKDSKGKALPHVYVSIDAASAESGNKESGRTFVAAAETDNEGNFNVSVPVGTYFVHAYQQAVPGLISPDEQTVTVRSGQSQSVNLNFQQASVPVTGEVLVEGKSRSGVLVSAWSEDGGFAQTETNANGEYTLQVNPATWHVSAAADLNGTGYRSSVSEVVAEAGKSPELDLQPLPVEKLAPPVSVTSNALAGAAVEMKNGAEVNLPAGAAGSKGNISLNVSQMVEAGNLGTANLLGAAYSVELRNATGGVINELDVPAVFTLPYDEKTVKAFGTQEKYIVPSYWDPAVGVWKELENAVIDTKDNVITATTTHFTRFALVAPADESPPAAPKSVSVKASGNKVALAWTNPGVDFHHTRIYRSEKQGSLGTLLADNVSRPSYDAKSESGKTYYFVVRSVDLAGNESKNLDQVTTASGKVKRK